mgnify:CR=1 FL=1
MVSFLKVVMLSKGFEIMRFSRTELLQMRIFYPFGRHVFMLHSFSGKIGIKTSNLEKV